jgi:2-phosphoglycerate kinase
MQPHYRDPLPLGEPDGLPYSKGMMARALLAAGVSVDSAYELATRLELDLVADSGGAVEPERFEQLAAEILGEDEGGRVVLRMRGLAALRSRDLPIVLLVGGATGTGKSTVATEAAHRLGITRVTSTDFIRQTIRAYFPPSEMPSVHASSFEAGGPEGEMEAGFLDQTRKVLVGVQASIDRALNEGWSMVIEGVHLVPGLVPAEIEGALLVHAVLRVETVEEHASHFVIRDATTGGERPLEKYLDGLPEIRALQDVIVERAVRYDVPVVESSSIGEATTALLDLVLSYFEEHADPRGSRRLAPSGGGP